MEKDQCDSIKKCQETIQNVIDELRNNGLPDFNLNQALLILNDIARDSSYEWWYDLKIGDTVRLRANQTNWRIIKFDDKAGTIKVKSGSTEGVFSFPEAFELKLLEDNH